MDQDRWQRLDRLFHTALEQTLDNRASYVLAACGDDHALRQELQAMLEHHEQANSFIELPAYMLDQETLIQSFSPEELVGREVGPYRIIKLLGMGGMGVVYLAFDEELHRNIALKFLTKDIATDLARVQRFRQEARAVSALNHPNILTIHQIGEVDGHQFIATEFVEGETLTEIIKAGRLTIGIVLDVAIQIVSALAAAHSANLIHRDIKPANVMVRPDGLVKVLDFGLAKLIEPSDSDRECTWEEAGEVLTETGILLGTIRYMSPEQLRGETLDGRTDLWSLGVVLYEMLTGREPFPGKTSSDMIAAILQSSPPSFGAIKQAKLQSLTARLLQKDRARRYQTANETLTDLHALKNRVAENDDEGMRLRPLPLSAHRRGPDTAKTLQNRQTSSVEYIVHEIRQHKLGAAIIMLVCAIAITGAVIGLSKVGRGRSTVAHPQAPTITRLTTRDGVGSAAVSPDGKYVVYAVSDPGCCFAQSLRLRQIATTSDSEIAPSSQTNYGSLRFSPDGNYLYFNDSNVLYKMPAFGGAKTRLISGISSAISFSPDGKKIAFFHRHFPSANETSLVTVNAVDGSGEQIVFTRKSPDRDRFDDVLAWSPTQAAIACAINQSDERGSYLKVVQVPLGGGAPETLSSQRWNEIESLAWLADGSALLMIAEDQSSIPAPQVWKLLLKDHVAQKITNDTNKYEGLSVTADSTILLTAQQSQSSSVWLVDAKGTSREVTTTARGNHDEIAWLTDGQILYEGNLGSQWDIWRLEMSQGAGNQLTFNSSANGESSVSPDGRYVVFASTRTGHINIWRMDADGANPRQLTNGNGQDMSPRCTVDNKWVVYESTRADHTTLWKVAIDGGDPVQLTNITSQHAAITPDGLWVIFDSDAAGKDVLWKVSINGGVPIQLLERSLRPVLSPDGKLIAARYQPDPAKDDWKIALLPIEGGSILRVLDIPAHPFWDRAGVQWSPDGKSLVYRVHRTSRNPNGVDDLWRRPIDGGPAKQLTHFDSNQIYSFAVSGTGEVALSRGVETKDIVIVNNF